RPSQTLPACAAARVRLPRTPASVPRSTAYDSRSGRPPGWRSMPEDPPGERPFVVVGGGPAGLTAAYELTKFGHRPLVFEKLDTVGGLARTANYKGFHFDMGGHRFFTKVPEVQKMWQEVLPDDFL